MILLRLPPLVVALSICISGWAYAQLQTLSSGKTDQAWRAAQLQLLDQQLNDAALPEDLRLELTAQKNWLARWQPQGAAAEPSPKNVRDNNSPQTRREPELDPTKNAAPFRARLFANPKAVTIDDTRALQRALVEQPDDLGLRQLQVQWMDQPQYRDKHWRDIVETCERVIALLQQTPEDDDAKLAMAFMYYRQARAWACGLNGLDGSSSVADDDNRLSPAERDNLLNSIVRCHQQIEALVGPDAPEFFALKIFALRRDGWTGRALAVLETHAAEITPEDFYAEQLSMLETLGWTAPAATLKQDASVRPSAKSVQSASSPLATTASSSGPLDGRGQRKLELRYRNNPATPSK